MKSINNKPITEIEETTEDYIINNRFGGHNLKTIQEALSKMSKVLTIKAGTPILIVGICEDNAWDFITLDEDAELYDYGCDFMVLKTQSKYYIINNEPVVIDREELKEFFDDTCNGEVVEQDIKPYLKKYKNITIILNPA